MWCHQNDIERGILSSRQTVDSIKWKWGILNFHFSLWYEQLISEFLMCILSYVENGRNSQLSNTNFISCMCASKSPPCLVSVKCTLRSVVLNPGFSIDSQTSSSFNFLHFAVSISSLILRISYCHPLLQCKEQKPRSNSLAQIFCTEN